MLKKMISFSLAYSMVLSCALYGEVVGFWKSVNEKSKKPESVIAIYEYNNKYFGRIVSAFNEDGSVETIEEASKSIAPGVKGNQPYIGMDIIWDLQHEEDKYKNGKILDPEKGKIYNAEMWEEGNNLVVRGEVLMFGRNQTWLKATEADFPKDFVKPQLDSLKPVIPEIK